jgi:hypothetical protein
MRDVLLRRDIERLHHVEPRALYVMVAEAARERSLRVYLEELSARWADRSRGVAPARWGAP